MKNILKFFLSLLIVFFLQNTLVTETNAACGGVCGCNGGSCGPVPQYRCSWVAAMNGCVCLYTPCNSNACSPGDNCNSAGMTWQNIEPACCIAPTIPPTAPPTSAPTAPPATPPPGWQPCGSCDCKTDISPPIGDNPECQINDVGVCVWNPGLCKPIIVVPAPSCTISLSPNPRRVFIGIPALESASVTEENGTVSEVRFSSSNSSIFVASSPDNSRPFTSVINGFTSGTATLTARATVTGAGGSRECSDTATVQVLPPPAWWQVMGDALSGIHITSRIPPTCTLPGCDPNFSRDDTGTFPGLTTYGSTGTYDFVLGAPTGTASSRGWLSQFNRNGQSYSSTVFSKLIPSTAQFTTLSGTVNGLSLASGGVTDSKGYNWYNATGNLTITGNVTLPAGRKVILFVNGGDLALQGRINFTDSTNFFMVVVGQTLGSSNGNINVAPNVTSPVGVPSLEGVYFADNTFSTGTVGAGLNDLPLRVRGSVVANIVQLERDLGVGNLTVPAEYFEFAKEILINYPQTLTVKHLIWREVAP